MTNLQVIYCFFSNRDSRLGEVNRLSKELRGSTLEDESYRHARTPQHGLSQAPTRKQAVV